MKTGKYATCFDACGDDYCNSPTEEFKLGRAGHTATMMYRDLEVRIEGRNTVSIYSLPYTQACTHSVSNETFETPLTFDTENTPTINFICLLNSPFTFPG